MNILFIGCVKSSEILLKKLIEYNKPICGVVTKKQSEFNSDFSDLSPICCEHQIPCIYYTKINDEEILSFAKKQKPDIIYCFGWSHLLKAELFDIPPFGMVGFHPAELPRNRGRHPLIWALVLGLDRTASTFFMIENGADTGDIISQKLINIKHFDDAESLYKKIMNVASEQLIQFTSEFENGTIKKIKQDNSLANEWRKRTEADGIIDFRMSSESIYNLVRALAKPYVGAAFIYKNKTYKVWKCEVIYEGLENYRNIEYGKVIKVLSKNSFIVKTGDGMLKIVDCEDIIIREGTYL